jgi:hypothetical protein
MERELFMICYREKGEVLRTLRKAKYVSGTHHEWVY